MKSTQHLRTGRTRKGASEQRTEPYMQYCEEAAQRATQRFAKSAGKMLGFAKDLASAAGGL